MIVTDDVTVCADQVGECAKNASGESEDPEPGLFSDPGEERGDEKQSALCGMAESIRHGIIRDETT